MARRPALSRARSATIGMQIHAMLRRGIVAGDYLPHQSISENELAQTFAVSRTPVREALGRLAEEHLISILPQYGTFVAPIRTSLLFGNQFVREALECAAVAEAAARCTPAVADALRAPLGAQRNAASDLVFFAEDEALHRTLMRIAGQSAAWAVVEAAKLTLDRVRQLSARHALRRDATYREHAEIVDDVIGGDRRGATAAMRRHLRQVFWSAEQMRRRHPEFFEEDAPAVGVPDHPARASGIPAGRRAPRTAAHAAPAIA